MHDSIEKRLSRSHCRTGVYSVEIIMYGWFRFDEATVDGTARALVARLDSPELEVRLRAAVLLAMMGVESDRGAGRPGTVEYLEEGYDLAEHADTRRTLVDMISMGCQAEADVWALTGSTWDRLVFGISDDREDDAPIILSAFRVF